MVPNPILIRSAQRRDGSRVVVVEETVGQKSIIRSLELDEKTFQGIERAFHLHPFPQKRPEDDVVLFKSLDTPSGTDQKYLGLEIVNQGSRRHLRIEASAEAFTAMKEIVESWVARMETARRATPGGARGNRTNSSA
jgi:hypothetical protein